MNIGKIIKENRLTKNMTQEDLASEFFVSRQLISKWENGKSYPDLEQLIKLSDFFDLTLDELMRGDKKMTKNLNVDIKKKKMLGLLSICLIIVTFNYFLSTVSFSVKKDSLKVTKTVIIRDKDYNGENSNRDWNTVLMTNVKSKNPFLKVDADSFIAKANKNRINGNVQMTFILFNIFNVNKETQVNQTVMLDNFIPNSKIQMSLEGTKEKITTTVY